MILLESRSGGALESNILSLLKELSREPYKNFNLVLSVRKNAESEIKEKLRKNSIQGVSFVHTGSVCLLPCLKPRRLSGQRFLFSRHDLSKKEGQIYLNTWHGTPLKKMGRDNRPEMVTMGNVLRNLLDSDYIVFPNRFMEEKMSGAYMLDSLYRGTVLREGYPRNDIFRQKPDLYYERAAPVSPVRHCLLTFRPTAVFLIR